MIVLLVIGLVTGAVVPVSIVAAAPQRMSNRRTGKNECGYRVPPIRKSVASKMDIDRTGAPTAQTLRSRRTAISMRQ
jgi:hypothetical protein